MKESQNSTNKGDDDKTEGFCYAIHNYLMCLFLEDHEEKDLKAEFKDRQKQIYDFYQSEFNKFVKPAKDAKGPDAQKAKFKEIFPKPIPRGSNKDTFGEFYDQYEEWVRTEFQKSDDEDDAGILDSEANFSSAIDSENK